MGNLPNIALAVGALAVGIPAFLTIGARFLDEVMF